MATRHLIEPGLLLLREWQNLQSRSSTASKGSQTEGCGSIRLAHPSIGAGTYLSLFVLVPHY
jgi:hypothetical protein